MFNNLGIQWAGTLLGCLAAICVPIPVCFYLFGKKLRQKSKFAPTMKPVKKDDEEESIGSESAEDDEDHQHGMSALHATRSVAHHEYPQRSRTRTRSDPTSRPNGTGVNSGSSNPAEGVTSRDVEKQV